MKIFLDIELAQAIQPQWTKLLGVHLVPPPVAAPRPEADILPFRNTKGASIRKMSCECSIFGEIFRRIMHIAILVFSDGMVPQVRIAWNGNIDLEMLRQFWERMGQPDPSHMITYNGLGFDLALRKSGPCFIK